MTSPTMRRPLPAVIALLALLLLTAIVWWRVLNRSTGTPAASNCSTANTPAATLPAPNLVTVQVLNATKRNGIGGKARSALVDDGFLSPAPAANDKPKTHIPGGVAQIRYGPKGAGGAKLLKFYLPNAHLFRTRSTSSTVIVSLGPRYRGIATPSAVRATLQKKNIALITTAPGQPAPSPTC